MSWDWISPLETQALVNLTGVCNTVLRVAMVLRKLLHSETK